MRIDTSDTNIELKLFSRVLKSMNRNSDRYMYIRNMLVVCTYVSINLLILGWNSNFAGQSHFSEYMNFQYWLELLTIQYILALVPSPNISFTLKAYFYLTDQFVNPPENQQHNFQVFMLLFYRRLDVNVSTYLLIFSFDSAIIWNWQSVFAIV